MKIIYPTLLFALLTLTASAQLQNINVPIPVFPVTTALVQSTVTPIVKGDTGTIPKAKKYSITAKSLLPIIAKDEFNAGKYGSDKFPAGAKLVFLANQESFTNSYYEVVGKTNQVLVVLTNLMTLEPAGGYIVDSYSEDNVTGLSNPFIDDYLGIITFNDLNDGGSLFFTMSFLVLATEEAEVIPKTEEYKETYKISIGGGSGFGYIGDDYEDAFNAMVYSEPLKLTITSTHPLP